MSVVSYRTFAFLALTAVTLATWFLLWVHTDRLDEGLDHSRVLADTDTIFLRMANAVDRRLSKGSLFTWESIVDEPPDTVFDAAFAELIKDYGDTKNCTFQSKWDVDTLVYMKRILEFWSDLANLEKIPYLLAYGSLLGYARDKDYVPYDADMDVFVPHWAFDRLAKYSSPLPTTDFYSDKVAIHLHPEYRHVPPELMRRFACNGTIVKRYEGLCSFTSPTARLSLNHRHLDLFTLDHHPDANAAVVVKDLNLKVAYDPTVYFPPRRCTFYGVPLYCPNNYVKLLRAWYGPRTASLRPHRICIDGRYVDRTKNPTAFEEYDKRWRERVGDSAADSSDDISGVYETASNQEFCKKWKIDPIEYGYCNFPPSSP